MKKFIVLLALFLSACGGSDSDDGPLAHTLTAFDVAGTSADEAGVAPIDPAVNGGDFDVSWSVQDAGSLFLVAMAVSEDEVPGEGDVAFFDRMCGGVTTTCPEAASFSRTCNFNNSNEIVCDDPTSTPVDMSGILQTIPFSGYIVIETCAITGFACSSESHPVRFD
ncbi:MAG: hypothetical protein KDH99_07855 [Alcanivoracaceae bacterium]|nr:hypothetical protein [Alcanivoracaceae bacterium]